MLESYNPLGTVQLPTSMVPPPVDVGAMVFLKAMEVTTSTSALDFTYAFDSTYDDYVLRIRDFYFTAANSEYIGMQFFINGSLVVSSTYSYLSSSLNTASTAGLSGSSNSSFLISGSNFLSGTSAFSGDINLVNAGSTTTSKGYFGFGAATNRLASSATNNNTVFNGTLPNSTSPLTGLRFFFANNNSPIIGGKFALYGIRRTAVRVSP
jgi:hypothetical protein